MGSRSLTASLVETSGSIADLALRDVRRAGLREIDTCHTASDIWCWGLIAAVSGLISVTNDRSLAIFAVLMAPKVICLRLRLRAGLVTGRRPEISRIIRARSVLVASLWSLAFAVVLTPILWFSALLVLVDTIATLMILATIHGEVSFEMVQGEGIRPLFPTAVRSWFQGRRVAICGIDQDMKSVLSRRMTEAGAMVIEFSTESGLRIRDQFREVRPSAVVMADQVDETRHEQTAISTRLTVNEALRVNADMILRVAIFPPQPGRHKVSLAHRVLEAFAGLTRTQVLTLGFPANRDREAIARIVMLRMATARRSSVALHSCEDSLSLWRTLDGLERKRIDRHPTRITGPRSLLEGPSQAPAR